MEYGTMCGMAGWNLLGRGHGGRLLRWESIVTTIRAHLAGKGFTAAGPVVVRAASKQRLRRVGRPGIQGGAGRRRGAIGIGGVVRAWGQTRLVLLLIVWPLLHRRIELRLSRRRMVLLLQMNRARNVQRSDREGPRRLVRGRRRRWR